MKKLLFLGLLLTAGISRAAYIESYGTCSASYTITNETVAHISTTNMHGGILVGVIIDSPSVGGTLTLADAYVSTTVAGIVYSTFSKLSLSGDGSQPSGSMATYIPFNVVLSSGLTYTTSNNTGGVTILYRSLQPGK